MCLGFEQAFDVDMRAPMVELVDTMALEAIAVRCGGSSPSRSTITDVLDRTWVGAIPDKMIEEILGVKIVFFF